MGITKRMNDHIFPKERKIPGSSEPPLQRLGHVHRLAGTNKHRAKPQFAAPRQPVRNPPLLSLRAIFYMQEERQILF